MINAPVHPVLVLAGVVLLAVAGVVVYPYISDRWQSLKTFGVWPPAKGSFAHRMAQRRVQRTIGTFTQEIDAAEVAIARIEQFWVDHPEQPDMLVDMARADRLEEDKARLEQRLVAARRLASKFEFQEPLSAPTGQTQNGKPQHSALEQTKELVSATSKSP